MNCAIYDKTKIQNQRVLINFLAGGLLAAAFALCVGCGEQRATEPTEAVLSLPETVDPINLFNKCLFEREMCEKTQPSSVCEQNQAECLENK